MQGDLTTHKSNIRQIDDCSESFVNACTTVKDKVAVDAFDSIAPMPARLLLSQFLLAHCYASGF